jgi:hypothetical protein
MTTFGQYLHCVCFVQVKFLRYYCSSDSHAMAQGVARQAYHRGNTASIPDYFIRGDKPFASQPTATTVLVEVSRKFSRSLQALSVRYRLHIPSNPSGSKTLPELQTASLKVYICETWLSRCRNCVGCWLASLLTEYSVQISAVDLTD